MKNHLGIFILVMVITLLSACKGPEGPAGPAGQGGPQGPTGNDALWENAISTIKDNVYMIGIIPAGKQSVDYVGTGWAISATQIITNAHVAYGIYDLCRTTTYNSTANRIVAVKNNTFTGQAGTYDLINCSVHPGYNNFNPFSQDFAIFTTNTNLSGTLLVEADVNLLSLAIGQSVGTLGFPGELIGIGDTCQPIATFKQGTISALRPFNQQTTAQSPATNCIIQYNFNTTDGTSGSPVFNSSGSIIGINNSGMSAIIKDYYGDLVRIGLGDLNFGIRIDKRTTITTMPYQVDVSSFRNPDPLSTSTLSAGQVRIKFSWNSSYDFDLRVIIGGTQCITAFTDESRANIYPFVVHHGDVTSYGSELATVCKLTDSVKVYVYKYSTGGSFSGSSVTCRIISSTDTIASITNPPTGSSRYWTIGTLSPSGTFTQINTLSNVDPLENMINGTQQMLKEMNVMPMKTKFLKSVQH